MKMRFSPAIAVLLLSALLRVVIACVNREANDAHLEVSDLLVNALSTGRLSQRIQDCWECYHPKIYHYFCAWIFYLFNLNGSARIICAQLINVTAGVIALYLVKLFLDRHIGSQRRIHLILFGLVALNPSLIKINIQATNDTFVISFGIAGSYLLYRFLQTRRVSFMIAASFSLCLAVLSKGNGMVLLTWANAVLFIRLFQSLRSGTSLRPAINGILVLSLVTLLAFSTTGPPLSPYRQTVPKLMATRSLNLRDFGKYPPLAFFERTYLKGKLGVISIYDSYLSFPFHQLLKWPYITNSQAIFPFHRSSLWAQLYGRIHFSYFDQFVWVRLDNATMLLGRLLMMTALIPTVLLILGFVRSASSMLLQLLKRPASFVSRSDWIFPILFAAYLASIILYSYDNRVFAAMKDIYIFPGLLAYLSALLSSISVFFRNASNPFRVLVTFNLIALLVLYCLNSAMVLEQFLL